MYIQFDFDTLGRVSDKAVKEDARQRVFDEIVALLTESFGGDFVSVVGSAEVAVSAGSKSIADGTVPEVPVVIKVIAKEFSPHSTASGKLVEAYDRYEEAADYAAEKAAADAKKAEQKAAAAKKAAADAKARELTAAKKQR